MHPPLVSFGLQHPVVHFRVSDEWSLFSHTIISEDCAGGPLKDEVPTTAPACLELENHCCQIWCSLSLELCL